MERSRRNPSGRRCDLLQPGGPKKTMQIIYFRHWDPLADLLYRMGILETGAAWLPCIFCQKRFASMFLSDGVRPHFLQAVIHHTFHKDDHIDKHPIQRYIHMVTSLLCLHLGKGTHTHYNLIKGILRHNPEAAMELVGQDCRVEEDPRSQRVYSLEQHCIRQLSVQYMKDLIFEIGAYKTWYELNRKFRIYTGQRRHRKMQHEWCDITGQLMPRGDGSPL